MLKIVEVNKKVRTQPTWDNGGNRAEYEAKPRVYFWFTDESIVDHLFNRKYEPWREFKKVMPDVLEQAGVKAKYNWSNKAGCKCGCSPGFILTENSNEHYDIFVDVEENGKDNL